MTEDPSYLIGHGRPPVDTRFKKGASGNPNGRPRKAKDLPYEAVLGRKIWVTEGGHKRKVPADEAFLLQLVSRAVAKEGSLRRITLELLDRRSKRGSHRIHKTVVIAASFTPGEVGKPMRDLGMARLLDPYRPSAKLVVESWLVELALARLGERRLTVAEQKTIVAATRKPHRVKWPAWWEVKSA